MLITRPHFCENCVDNSTAFPLKSPFPPDVNNPATLDAQNVAGSLTFKGENWILAKPQELPGKLIVPDSINGMKDNGEWGDAVGLYLSELYSALRTEKDNTAGHDALAYSTEDPYFHRVSGQNCPKPTKISVRNSRTFLHTSVFEKM